MGPQMESLIALNAARGGVYVTDNGVNLTGEKDIFGHPFNSALMSTAQTLAISWNGGIWNGSRWTGDGWAGSRWRQSVDRIYLGRQPLVQQRLELATTPVSEHPS